jgi:hypothetical protein
MANENNLIPKDSNQSREEARINGKKGGIASGKAKRQRKTMKMQLELLMSSKLDNPDLEKIKKVLTKFKIPKSDENIQMAMNVSMVQQALKGNTKAYEIIRDTLGEKPADKIENINPPVINIERPINK